jgi:hypothetical protein
MQFLSRLDIFRAPVKMDWFVVSKQMIVDDVLLAYNLGSQFLLCRVSSGPSIEPCGTQQRTGTGTGCLYTIDDELQLRPIGQVRLEPGQR